VGSTIFSVATRIPIDKRRNQLLRRLGRPFDDVNERDPDGLILLSEFLEMRGFPDTIQAPTRVMGRADGREGNSSATSGRQRPGSSRNPPVGAGAGITLWAASRDLPRGRGSTADRSEISVCREPDLPRQRLVSQPFDEGPFGKINGPKTKDSVRVSMAFELSDTVVAICSPPAGGS
jgi:hypothetical protein